MQDNNEASWSKWLTNAHLIAQGAEARIFRGTFSDKPAILKERFVKKYRHPDLDKTLSTERIKSESRAITKCLEIGIKCPALFRVDLDTRIIILEDIVDSTTVRKYLEARDSSDSSISPLFKRIGCDIAKMHDSDLVHGDLTTSNMLLKNSQVKGIENEDFDLYFIDFGLSRRGASNEEKAVDLYVLERALLSSHPGADALLESTLNSYFGCLLKNTEAIKNKLNEVRLRGRKRSMVG